MRRGTIVAGLTSGLLLIGGAAAASAADQPIAIVFTNGTTAFGSLATVPSASATAEGAVSLQGTISTTTLTARFPASTVKFPQVTVPSVDYGTGFGSGKLVVDATPFEFTGKPSATLFSLDLSGTVAYKFTATTSMGALSCNSEAPVPYTLTGSAIDPATGAYGVSGSQTNLILRASDPTNVQAGLFCTALAAKLTPGAQITSKFSGNLAIPGLIPVAAPTSTAPKPTTPTTPTAPSTPTTTAKKGRLAVSISRPKTVRRGSSTVTRVVVRNTGAGTARSVSVKVAAGKGVTPRTTTKTYSSIAAGKSRTINLRLRTTRTTARSSAVKVTAKGASGLSASKATTLRLK